MQAATTNQAQNLAEMPYGAPVLAIYPTDGRVNVGGIDREPAIAYKRAGDAVSFGRGDGYNWIGPRIHHRLAAEELTHDIARQASICAEAARDNLLRQIANYTVRRSRDDMIALAQQAQQANKDAADWRAIAQSIADRRPLLNAAAKRLGLDPHFAA